MLVLILVVLIKRQVVARALLCQFQSKVNDPILQIIFHLLTKTLICRVLFPRFVILVNPADGLCKCKMSADFICGAKRESTWEDGKVNVEMGDEFFHCLLCGHKAISDGGNCIIIVQCGYGDDLVDNVET